MDRQPDIPDGRGLVVVQDDGELEDVRGLLRSLDLDFRETPPPAGGDVALRITTPRRLLARSAAGPGPAWRARHCIVVCDGGARAVRAQVERLGCDFIVDRPVHPAALRLLVLHALYDGPGKRRRPRAALSDPVKLRGRLWTRSALLVQLSSKGAGLVVRHAPKPGETFKLSLPPSLTGALALSVGARVIDRRDAQPDHDGTLVSVVFDSPPAALAPLVNRILRSRPRLEPDPAPRPEARSASSSPGPPVRGGEAREDAARPGDRRGGRPAPSTQAAAGGDASTRASRASPRKQYHRAVLASRDGGATPLLGRDVSTGGMRVAACGSLALGDELKLALYGPPGVPPLLVKAVVDRDDGPAGWMLRFLDLDAGRLRSLEQLLSALPILASPLRGDEASAREPDPELLDGRA